VQHLEISVSSISETIGRGRESGREMKNREIEEINIDR
jgi:hypothetical protein